MTPFAVKVLDYEPGPDSAEAERSSECMTYRVDGPRSTTRGLGFDFSLAYLFPVAVARRYTSLLGAISLVWVDHVRGSCEVARFQHDAFVTDGSVAPRCLAPPPLPLERRGDPRGESHTGGWVNGTVFVQDPWDASSPVRVGRPRWHSYVILENHVSNVVALHPRID